MPLKLTKIEGLLTSNNYLKLSISKKLSIALISLSTIPMSFMAYNELKLGIEDLVRSESEELQTLAVSNASRFDQLITDKQIVINQIAREPDTRDFLATKGDRSPIKQQLYAKVDKDLEIVLRSSADYDAVFIMDKNGICRASTDPTFVGQNYGFRNYFKQAVQAEGAAPTSIAVDVDSDRLGLYFSHPIKNKQGKTLGVAVLKIRGSEIQDAIDSVNIDSHVEAFLLDEQGIFVAHPDDSLLYRSLDKLPAETQKKLKAEKTYGSQKIKSLELPKLAQAMVKADQKGNVSYYSPTEKTSQIVGFSPLENEPWVLGVSKPRIIFEAPIRAMIWQNGRLILLVGGVASLCSVLISRQLVKPIRDLTEAGKALQQGEFEPESLADTARSQDDLGMLARVFVQMAEEINQREQSLKSQVEDLQIKIDESQKERQIAEITETEYFAELKQKAQELKK